MIYLGGRPDRQTDTHTRTHMHTHAHTRNLDSIFGAASDVGHGVPTAKLGIKESVRVRAVSLGEGRYAS